MNRRIIIVAVSLATGCCAAVPAPQGAGNEQAATAEQVADFKAPADAPVAVKATDQQQSSSAQTGDNDIAYVSITGPFYYVEQGTLRPLPEAEVKGLALIRAVQKGNVDDVRTLLAQGAFVDMTDECGCTALWWAAERNNVEVLKLLIDAKASVDKSENVYRCTPLMIAATDANVKAVETLLAAGANVKAVDNKQETALHAAAYCNLYEIEKIKKEEYKTTIKVFLQAGIDQKLRNDEGKTAYDIALEHGDADIAELLK